jgi:putative phage-type endonuclease
LKLYKKQKFKTKGEWLNNRSIGGSSASALFGANPYMTPLDIYCASVSPVNDKEDGDNETTSTIYGQENEPILRELAKINFANQYEIESPDGFVMYRRKDKPFMSATLDGLMTTKSGKKEKWILEIKTHDVKSNADLEEWNGHLPQNYFIQCLHYMAVLNDTKGAWLMAKLRFIDYETGLPRTADKGKCGEEIRYYKIERKDFLKDIAKLEQVETDFQINHIEKRIPPEINISIMEE